MRISTYLSLCAIASVFIGVVRILPAQTPVSRIHSEITNAASSPLKASKPLMAEVQYDAGRLPADTRLEGIILVFNRSAAQESAVKALIAAQQDPSSPAYHRWLTPEQFAARFGLSDSDLTKAQNWLQEQGFAIDSVARSKNAIRFTGTARQVEQAFSTEMHIFQINGTQHFGPATALRVPSALAPTVLAINHLDDFHPRAHVILSKNRSPRPAFTFSQTGEVFFAPGDIATVYDVGPLYSASITGTGQTIALVGQSAIQNSDIEAFQTAAGFAVKDPVQILVPNTGDSEINPDGAGDELESDLDVEWAGAIAPGATIDFVYTGNSSNNSGAFDAISYAIDQDLATIISSSYGTCEADLGSFSLESVLEQAATQGQTVISAAGDDGSTDCYGNPDLTSTQQETLAVDYPASSPNVTGIGGTEISSTADNGDYLTAGDGYWSAPGNSDIVDSALQYIPEVAWNDDDPNCGATNCLSSGGGGASSLFNKPTWQTGVAGIPSDGKRDVPDLALYASPNYPGYLYCSSDPQTGFTGDCTNGFRDSSDTNLAIAGGTSFDAPIFSGILALINQKAGYTEGQGLINGTLYTLAANSTKYASAFHDITSGTNDCTAGSSFCSGAIGFSARTGYDQVTGLGSIDAASLADVWPMNSSGTTNLINTTTGITASSNSPNVNASDTFTITTMSITGTTVPTGQLAVTVDGGSAISETLTSNGSFTYSTSFASTGSHTLLARYAGDSTHAASSSGITVTVGATGAGNGTFTLSAAPSTLTVSQGSSGSETINVTPASGYSGTVDLTFETSDDTSLQNLCYTFSSQDTAGDGIVTISGTSAGTVQLVLDTNASDCSTPTASAKTGMRQFRMPTKHSPRLRRHPISRAGANSASVVFALAGLLLSGCWGRYSRRFRPMAGVVVLVAVTLLVSSCGSGGGASSVAVTTATPTFSLSPGTYSTSQVVTISDSTPSATIYYTTDGTKPTSASTTYTVPIKIASTETIEAIAIASGDTSSAVASAAYTIGPPPVTATPTFSPVAGTYTSAQSVTIMDATSGAAIYYTTDGSTPNTTSLLYSAPIQVSSTETIEAIAIANGDTSSAVASATYTIGPPPVTAGPSFSPAPGSYSSAQSVSLTDVTSGAAIYYTTDGSTPTTSSPIYSAPIQVSSTETIQAIAVATGDSPSPVTTATYTITSPNPPKGTYTITVTGTDSTTSTITGSTTFTFVID